MGDWKVDGPDGEKIESVPQMFGRFSGQVLAKTSDWQKRLHEQPEELEVIEREVRHEFTRGADLMVAALSAVVMASPELEASSEETRNHYGQPLAKGRPRSIRIPLLGGLIFWVTSLYCEPRKGVFRKKKDGARGVHIELEKFGFGKSISPGLESRVSRQAALCPSFELAQSELGRDGLNLDVKAVRRIAQQCGENLLRLRTFELQQRRNGELPATNELASESRCRSTAVVRSCVVNCEKGHPLQRKPTTMGSRPAILQDVPRRRRSEPSTASGVSRSS